MLRDYREHRESMFRAVELGQTVPRKEFKKRSLILRQQLLEAQIQLGRTNEFSVLIDFEGVDAAGKGSMANTLHSWMDTRLIRTNAYGSPTEADRMQPMYWRFWRDLPRAGRIAINLSGRYSRPFLDRANQRISEAEYVAELKRVQAFERALADDGTLILKFWMHLGRDAQEDRLKSLESDPDTSWRVTLQDWDNWGNYDRFIETAERAITETNTEFARWHIVDCSDENHRTIAVAQILRDTLRARLKKTDRSFDGDSLVDKKAMDCDDTIPDKPAGHVSVFDTLDMSAELDKHKYRRKLAKQQRRLHLLQRDTYKNRRSSIVVMEGPDASGKGGAIRRLIPTLDARNYRVLQYGKPTDEEAARHYLWRFWQSIQPAGRLTIFDRSWYGRVLVERVEGFASEPEWRRAFAEINEFENQLIENGTILVKFWLHISLDQQKARFDDRRKKTYKQWKLTTEDWRNRGKWYEYEDAAHDVIKYTSTHASPWEIIPANNKNFARISVLKTFADYLEAALEKH